MRNASVSVSHDAIVDVRRWRPPPPPSPPPSRNDSFNISKIVTARNFNIYHNIAFDSLCTVTGNTSQATSDWQQIAQTYQFFVMLGSSFLDNGSIVFQKGCSLGKDASSASFPVLNGNHLDRSSSTHYINGWFRFSRKPPKLATHELTRA